jgi:predicted small integral membrane protein
MSEWIWWFGYWGCIIGGAITALMTLAPLIIGFKLKLTKFSLMLISIASLYFIMAGTSMSLRSSSRLFIYVITAIIFKDILERLIRINVKTSQM